MLFRVSRFAHYFYHLKKSDYFYCVYINIITIKKKECIKEYSSCKILKINKGTKSIKIFAKRIKLPYVLPKDDKCFICSYNLEYFVYSKNASANFNYLKYFVDTNACEQFETFVLVTFYIKKDEDSQVWESKVFKRHPQPHQLNLERFHSKNTSRFINQFCIYDLPHITPRNIAHWMRYAL